MIGLLETSKKLENVIALQINEVLPTYGLNVKILTYV
jgi:hypothetical protein